MRGKREGTRTLSKTTDANIDCAFVENALFYTDSLIVKSQQNRIELVTRPGLLQPLQTQWPPKISQVTCLHPRMATCPPASQRPAVLPCCCLSRTSPQLSRCWPTCVSKEAIKGCAEEVDIMGCAEAVGLADPGCLTRVLSPKSSSRPLGCDLHSNKLNKQLNLSDERTQLNKCDMTLNRYPQFHWSDT